MRFVATYAILAIGLFSKAEARALPDDNSAANVNVDANVDLKLGTGVYGYEAAYDAYDEYSKRSPAVLSAASAASAAAPTPSGAIDAVLSTVDQLNTQVQPLISGVRTCCPSISLC